MERSIDNIVIEGKLESITHKYDQDKFDGSFITIKDKKDKKIKREKIHGIVPESFLGKNVCLGQLYKGETAELYQELSYRIKGNNFIVETYISNVEKPWHF